MSFLSATRATLAAAAVAAAVFTTAGTIAPTEAEARSRVVLHVGHVHGFRHGYYLRPRVIVPVVALTAYGAGCGWMYRRAMALGSPYWMARYHTCMGH